MMTWILLPLLALLGGGCAGDSHWVDVQGAVEKGPFVVGSSVTISTFDVDGIPTGETFNTETSNGLGQFDVPISLDAARQTVLLEARGFYYNEASGALSDANLTLRATTELSTDQAAASIYINLITHLTHNRVNTLLEAGSTVPEAIAQAESELRTALGIGPDGFDPQRPGTELNLLGNDDPANAYLLLVSAVLAEHSEGSDSGLQELLNRINNDFADDGEIAQSLTMALGGTESDLIPDKTILLFRERLEALGSSVVLPNLHSMVDADGDGVVNADDVCRYTDDDQTDTDGDGVGDACDGDIEMVVNDGRSCVILGGANAGIRCLQEAPVGGDLGLYLADSALLSVSGTFTDVASTYDGTCALTTEGMVTCWDAAGASRAGPSGTFTEIDGFSHELTGPAVGDMPSYCGLTSTNALQCFEFSEAGVLSTTLDIAPVAGETRVELVHDGIASMETDIDVCFRIQETGAIQCYNDWVADVSIAPLPTEPVSSYDMYKGFGCGILTMTGGITCWGGILFELDERQLPDSFNNATGVYTQVSVGEDAFCAIREDGYVDCWALVGDSTPRNHQRIYPTTDRRFTSIDLTGTFNDFRTGACGITTEGALHCWEGDTSTP